MFKVKFEPFATERAIVRHGFTRAQISEKTGISTATLARVFNGQSCSIKTAIKIIDTLEEDPENLLISFPAPGTPHGSARPAEAAQDPR